MNSLANFDIFSYNFRFGDLVACLLVAGFERECVFRSSQSRIGERGSNENANRLVRHYFPKGIRFADLSDEL